MGRAVPCRALHHPPLLHAQAMCASLTAPGPPVALRRLVLSEVGLTNSALTELCAALGETSAR